MHRVTELNPPLRILVVDDHRDTADALAWLLQSIGHQAHAVYDGPSALRALEQHAPHVVLQDLALPAMNGFEIAREMRRRTAAGNALLVAMSGSPRPRAPLEDAAAFDDFLPKPVGLVALQEMLASAWLRRQAGGAH